MITCKACKFWTRNGAGGGEQPTFGVCASPHVFTGYGHADDTLPLSAILVEDDEGWAMETGPDFGCIHAVAQEPDEPTSDAPWGV